MQVNKKMICLILMIIMLFVGFFLGKNSNDNSDLIQKEFVRGNYVNDNNKNMYMNLKLDEEIIEYYNGQEYIVSSHYNIINEKIVSCELESIGKCIFVYDNDSFVMIFERDGQYVLDNYTYRGSEFVYF